MKYLSTYTWLLAMLLLLRSASVACAQAPVWQSLTGINSAAGSNSQVNATTVDANGNVILVGSFSGTVSFGNITLTSTGGLEAFVAKLNPTNGSFVWAYPMGGSGYDEATAVAVGGTNIYVTGSFNSSTATFGPLSQANSSGSYYDAFIVKLTDAGSSASFVWVQQPTGSRDEYGIGLAVNGNQIYWTGKMKGAVGGPPGAPGGTPVCFPCYDVVSFGTVASFSTLGTGFVAKLIDAGSSASFVWILPIQEGGPKDIDARSMAVSGSNIYVTGSFAGLYTMNFGAVTLPILGPDIQGFVAKVTDNGTTCSVAWVKRLGTSNGEGNAVVASGTAVYVAGSFGGTGAFGTISLASTGAKEAFVAKLTDTGPDALFDWATRAGGTGDDVVTALATRGANVYATGFTGSTTTDFGPITLSNAASRTLFVTKLSSGASGGFAWVQATGGMAGASATAASLGIIGSQLYVSGTATPAVPFGSLTLASQTGTTNGFLASLADPTLTATGTALRPESISLYPNPAHGRAAVQLPALPGAATATLTVLDALGRALRTQTAATNAKAELDLTGLAPGLYAVRVAAGGSTATQRLVVE